MLDHLQVREELIFVELVCKDEERLSLPRVEQYHGASHKGLAQDTELIS